jgi:hypothetical protein
VRIEVWRQGDDVKRTGEAKDAADEIGDQPACSPARIFLALKKIHPTLIIEQRRFYLNGGYARRGRSGD